MHTITDTIDRRESSGSDDLATRERADWLAVDLDGTLHVGDTSWEGLASLCSGRKGMWRSAAALLVAATRGRASFKTELAARHELPDSYLRWRPEVLELIGEAKAAGRSVVLATGAPRRIADRLIGATGMFDRVVASSGAQNVVGVAKRDALNELCGVGNWEYAGDSTDDLEVWAAARRAYIVSPRADVLQLARERGLKLLEVGSPRQSTTAALWQGVRPHQWAKNALILAPPVLAHGPGMLAELGYAFVAATAFSLVASATYLLNDLLDLPNDRHHPTKARRPIASGALPIPAAVLGAAALAITGLGLAVLLPWPFVLVLATYVLITLAYSFDLKRRPLVDVVVLAGLYVARLVAGAVASGVPLSFWLLAFALFLFFSLAVAKRATELGRMDPAATRTAGRGYLRSDLEPLTSLGVASGVTAVLVFALYMNAGAADGLYQRVWILWFVCPVLLYWIARVWVYVRRDWIDDDPVAYALKDRTSRLCAIVVAAVFALAVFPW